MTGPRRKEEMRTAACLFLLSVSAWAIAPPYVSDPELAKFPILVVVRWDGPAIQADGEPLFELASAQGVALFFLSNGHRWGWNAWMGRVEVESPK